MKTYSPAQYAALSEKRAKQFEIKASDAVAEMAVTAGTTIATETPVDTGRARANWHSGATDNDEPIFKGEDKTGSVSIQRIVKAANAKKPRQSIFLYNNLPYIGRLNAGSSDQAPAGFVEKAIAKARKKLMRRKFV